MSNVSKFMPVVFQGGGEGLLKVGQAKCDTMGDMVGDDERSNGFQRCREFLGGAWTLATSDQFSMEYIRYVR